MQQASCSVPECEGRAIRRGWCSKHYQRWRRWGDPLEGRHNYPIGATCKVPDCGQWPAASWYCPMHYQRVKTYGEPGPAEPSKGRRAAQKACKVDGCGHPVDSLLMCKLHYERNRRHGDPGPPGRIYAPAGSGYMHQGYRIVYRNGQQVKEHRAVMEDLLGRPLLPSEEVHHRNGRRADNRPANLELWVRRQPPGQRAADLLAWAEEIVARYGPERDKL